MRDILSHHYFGVNPEVVWEAGTKDVTRIQPIFLQIQTELQHPGD